MGEPLRVPASRPDVLNPNLRVHHSCGALIGDARVSSPLGEADLVVCPGCGARWKKSTLAAFTDEQLAQRFYLEWRPPPEMEHVTWSLIWVTKGPTRFVASIPGAADLEQLPDSWQAERVRC